jgi:predicted component of viral defense system (DUF524 family)
MLKNFEKIKKIILNELNYGYGCAKIEYTDFEDLFSWILENSNNSNSATFSYNAEYQRNAYEDDSLSLTIKVKIENNILTLVETGKGISYGIMGDDHGDWNKTHKIELKTTEKKIQGILNR